MFKTLLVWILKRSYNRTIMKVSVLDKQSHKDYNDIEPFCTLDMKTDLGPFVFRFKEDRRKRKVGFLSGLFVRTYIVHLTPPEGLAPTKTDLSEKIVLAVNVMLLRPNYDVLTQVLIDIYLDVMLDE